MKKYEILDKIVLGFLTHDDSDDVIISPKPDTFLEADDHTIWLVNKNGRFESHTTITAIQHWLEQGKIK